MARHPEPPVNLPPELTRLCDTTGRVVYFPVRHHSPTAARLVCDLIDRIEPAAVLIEGPADFNDRMAELFLPHRPPIAIYSYVLYAHAEPVDLPPGFSAPPGVRRGVYYPMCEHSPEWQAARHGNARGAAVRFIDLPWADLIGLDDKQAANRYADTHFQKRGGYMRAVCERLGVDTFNDAWDTLCEVDPHLTLEEYLHRCHALCGHMRLSDGEPAAPDLAREDHMAGHIRAALVEFDGPVLVVTGGYHSLGLLRLMATDLASRVSDNAGSEPDPSQGRLAPNVLDRGIALTPYSFDRLDALHGYDAGMPNPGFYHAVWKARAAKKSKDVHEALLRDVVSHLRDQKQQVSSADLIAAEATARALAAVRGHAEVWRTDFVDGLTGAVVKEEVVGMRHPILDAVNHVLRGGERGMLAEGTRLPPLVADLRAELDRLKLVARPDTPSVTVKLTDPFGRERSRLMHRIRLLELGGYILDDSTLNQPEAAELEETWRIAWAPDFDAHCIEASRYGATTAEATAARLLEMAGTADRDAAAASRLLLDAALAGLESLSDDLLATVRRLIHTDGDFFGVAVALGRLLSLYRYDTALGTVGRPDLGQLLSETFARALWLLESLGQTVGKDRETVAGIRALLDTFDRCDAALGLDRNELVDVLKRVSGDAGQTPLTRGATLGALWAVGSADGELVMARLREFADPALLGDFLGGVFALAREQVQRQKNLLLGVNDVLTDYATDEFLTALPPLRLAFTYFTPREKHYLALTLREALGLGKEPEMAALSVDADTAAHALKFEDALFKTAEKYGIRMASRPSDGAGSVTPAPSLGRLASEGQP